MSSNKIPINDSTVESSKDNAINNSSDINPSVEGSTGTTTPSTTISQASDTLKNINTIKDELCKLPLDPCENEYIINSVLPLTNILYMISTASVNLSNSANILTNSPIVHAKKSEIKDTIDLIYNINEECEDLFKVIKKRLNVLLK
ncbi:hypothetical protein LGK95_19445 [Clostridium algoriphilum]|uniref:hypothetical protein n=1 Tax=Clostridium algoriphilum TaxID=198347 RepID=UPI001CF46A63|nr:hypothetical protein [Clostridium algoriphilum]MCB2295654.1 hypothetical protein [Clostridium algoriphilum]